MGTRGQWARDFLAALGNPNPSAATVNLIAVWSRQESNSNEPEAASYNPLNTTLEYGTHTDYNSVGVKNYATRQQGLEASVITLRGDYAGYSDIVAGLRTNDPERALAGMKASPWGTNFGRVESIWRSEDATNELLPGENPAKWRSNVPTKAEKSEEIDSPEGPAEPAPNSPEQALSVLAGKQITGDDIRWSLLSMAGAALIALGVLLGVIAISKGNMAAKVVRRIT